MSSLERQLALQLQITEAARRLCAEENLSKQMRRQRKHAALQEEKKLRELQRSLGERRRNSEPPPATTVQGLGQGEAAGLGVRGGGQCDAAFACSQRHLSARHSALTAGIPAVWVHLDPILPSAVPTRLPPGRSLFPIFLENIPLPPASPAKTSGLSKTGWWCPSVIPAL